MIGVKFGERKEKDHEDIDTYFTQYPPRAKVKIPGNEKDVRVTTTNTETKIQAKELGDRKETK